MRKNKKQKNGQKRTKAAVRQDYHRARKSKSLTSAQSERMTNDLIGLLWPELDKGVPESDLMDLVNNVFDSWEPV